MYLDSIHWNRQTGVCTLHGLPSVPCPACIAEKHSDLEAVISRVEAEDIVWGFTLMDEIVPSDFIGFNFADVRIGE